jgi:hypothetical protein
MPFFQRPKRNFLSRLFKRKLRNREPIRKIESPTPSAHTSRFEKQYTLLGHSVGLQFKGDIKQYKTGQTMEVFLLPTGTTQEGWEGFLPQHEATADREKKSAFEHTHPRLKSTIARPILADGTLRPIHGFKKWDFVPENVQNQATGNCVEISHGIGSVYNNPQKGESLLKRNIEREIVKALEEKARAGNVQFLFARSNTNTTTENAFYDELGYRKASLGEDQGFIYYKKLK